MRNIMADWEERLERGEGIIRLVTARTATVLSAPNVSPRIDCPMFPEPSKLFASLRVSSILEQVVCARAPSPRWRAGGLAIAKSR